MKRIIYIISLVFTVTIFSACRSHDTNFVDIENTKFEEIENQEWQYVVLGDGNTERYPEILAEKIEQEQNVAIAIKHMGKNWGLYSSSKMLATIKKNEFLRDAISNAELITFFIPLNGYVEASELYIDNQCGGYDNQDCLREALKTYKQDTEDIVSELVSLIDKDSTVVLAHTLWPELEMWFEEIGTLDMPTNYWKEANSQLISVCEENGIPVARVYEAFMGADGSKNPREDGLLDVGFLVFPTPEGQEMIANLLYELGK